MPKKKGRKEKPDTPEPPGQTDQAEPKEQPTTSEESGQQGLEEEQIHNGKEQSETPEQPDQAEPTFNKQPDQIEPAPEDYVLLGFERPSKRALRELDEQISILRKKMEESISDWLERQPEWREYHERKEGKGDGLQPTSGLLKRLLRLMCSGVRGQSENDMMEILYRRHGDEQTRLWRRIRRLESQRTEMSEGQGRRIDISHLQQKESLSDETLEQPRAFKFPSPDWRRWIKEDLWTHEQAACLLCDIEPYDPEPAGEKARDLQNTCTMVMLAMNRHLPRVQNWYRVIGAIDAAIRAGELRQYRSGYLLAKDVIEWAYKEIIHVPKPLRVLRSAPSKEEEEAKKDAERGRKVREGGKTGSEIFHGTREERRENAQRYRKEYNWIKQNNRLLSHTEICKLVGKKYGWSYKTIDRHLKEFPEESNEV